MALPVINNVTPRTATVGTVGISIKGTNFDNLVSLNLIQSGNSVDITSFVTSKKYSEIRFKMPNLVSGKYYLQVETSEGVSNVY